MLEDVVIQTILKYNMIQKNDKVVVAVSGGPDSMALLNALINLKEKLDIQLFVAHVNHMIRSSADSETEYVKQFCKDKNIECFVKKVDVIKRAKLEKISTEMKDMLFLMKYIIKLKLTKLPSHTMQTTMQKPLL